MWGETGVIFDTCGLLTKNLSSKEKLLFCPRKTFFASLFTVHANCIKIEKIQSSKKFSCFINAGLMPNRNGKRSIYFAFRWRGFIVISCELLWLVWMTMHNAFATPHGYRLVAMATTVTEYECRILSFVLLMLYNYDNNTKRQESPGRKAIFWKRNNCWSNVY